MRKIAIPVLDHKLSPHFGDCSYFIFFYIKNESIFKEELISPPSQLPELIPNWLVKKGVTDVIAAGIGLKPIEILNQQKINVFVGVKEEDPKVLVQEYLDGILETNGNLCDH